MANTLTVSRADVRPLPGALCRRFTASGTVLAGDAVYIDTSGEIAQADAVTFAHLISPGIAVADNSGGTAFADNDELDVCVHGPIAGFTSSYEGSFAFVAGTVGVLIDDDAGSGNYRYIIGQSHSTQVLFINPWSDNLAQLSA